ncbi:MAG TPA: type II toxin-antitoxin system death-on-curing family toxin [Tepidisphaeraceae bacterium]
MDDPIWISKELAIAIHHRQIAEHGGSAGTRDANLLESALARPRQQFAYADPTPEIPVLAAAYAYGIARNHPFIDGNKRTAAVVCETFLEMNHWQLTADDVEMFKAFLAMAAGDLPEKDFVAWVKSNSAPEAE